MHKIVYLPLAEQDLLSAVRYISEALESPGAASSLMDEVEKTVGIIAAHPYAFHLYKTNRPMKDEIRQVSVKNYVLYFAVFEDRVEIRRFLHQRRDRRQELVEETQQDSGSPLSCLAKAL